MMHHTCAASLLLWLQHPEVDSLERLCSCFLCSCPPALGLDPRSPANRHSTYEPARTTTVDKYVAIRAGIHHSLFLDRICKPSASTLCSSSYKCIPQCTDLFRKAIFSNPSWEPMHAQKSRVKSGTRVSFLHLRKCTRPLLFTTPTAQEVYKAEQIDKHTQCTRPLLLLKPNRLTSNKTLKPLNDSACTPVFIQQVALELNELDSSVSSSNNFTLGEGPSGRSSLKGKEKKLSQTATEEVQRQPQEASAKANL
eukprot:219949-Amphidinium_carterae.1